MKSSSSLLWNVFLGLLFWVSVAQTARASSLIHAKAKAAAAAATATPVNATITEDEVPSSQPTLLAKANETVPTNVTKLTGVPQIDYVHDPNLPRELNGHNLTDYPFYNSLPEEIDFKCDGLHDGFYASVPHQCQVYHHCLFGTRYDFLCANYTAFDQRTFICHFASEVDCKNSPKFFKRNEALYKAASTTTVAPLTTVAPPSNPGNGRRRRPFRRRKPAYDYYDEYEYEDYEDGDDRPREGGKRPRPPSKASEEEPLPSGPNKALYDRPRVAPKIRRPVPVNERDKYDYSSDSRVIPTKASQEESSASEDDKTETNKRKNKPREGEKRDRDRYRERERFSDRDEESDDREDDRDRGRNRDDDRERPRNRRPAKKRKRPDPYDYYDEYEDVRRPKPRERPRYEDEDEDYEDDRYYRKPARNRDHDRPRERERDRERYRPVEDEEERRGKPRRREYEDEEERYPSKESEERPRDDRKGSKNDDRKKPADTSSRGAIETPKKAPEDTYSDETIETDSKVYEDEEVEKQKPKPKPRVSTTKAPPVPVPAARPAYITQTSKKLPEPQRKPAGFRRPTTPKYSEEEEEVEIEDTSKLPVSTEKPYSPFRSGSKRRQQEQLLVNVPEPVTEEATTTTTQKPIVADQELAPRAPKVPMSSRRRPFLPSRGGDPSLLRGLTPVGAKAFTAPKKEDVAVPVPQPSPAVVEKRFPTGIEFRTRVGANLGVEQPRLTPTIQEEPYSQEDYSGEITDSEESTHEDFTPRQSQTKQEIYRITEKVPTPIRPTLRTTDFPSLADVHGEIEHHTQIQQESRERKYSSRLPSNQYQQPKTQTYQQLGPQTFFSENPKFQTNDQRQNFQTNEQRQNFQTNDQRQNFQTNDQRQNFQPAFYQPIIKPGQGQVQVVHFQKTVPRNPVLKFPQENSEDTDEYDVSFNDALQPISTLHPRNAQTGVVGSQRVSVRRRMPVNQQFNSEERGSGPKNENQRIAATISHPHAIHPPASFTRNIYQERPIYVR